MPLWELAPRESRAEAIELLDRMVIEHERSTEDWENPDPDRYREAVSAFLADARGSRWDARVMHRDLTDDVWVTVGRFLETVLGEKVDSVPSQLQSVASRLPNEFSADQLWLMTNALLAGMVYE